MEVATIRDLIKALQKYPMDTPVFGYDDMMESDFPVQVVEYCQMNENGGVPVHYCQNDSFVFDYWDEKGVCPILYLRPRNWRDN